MVLAPVLALANGRPPLTNGVFVRPGDDHSIFVRTTFGLLISHDDGCSFRWVCEKAIGYGGEFDPKYAIATDGTMFATTFTGLRVSRDGGCEWKTATEELPVGDAGRIADTWIDAIDLSPNGDVWVATAESAKPNNVFRSTDNGVTFAPKGLFSPTVWYKSVKVARSDPQRIYVTGYQVAPDSRAHLFRSEDGGTTWTEVPLFGTQRPHPTIQYGSTPLLYVVAVDPANPDILFVNSQGANPPGGDRLYRSADGGRSFDQVLATTDPIRGIVIRSSGVIVATLAGGSFESPDGTRFVPLGSTLGHPVKVPQLACLGQRGDGSLVGCGANWGPDFMAVGGSVDGGSWQKLFRFVELAGPLECPGGTKEQDMCAPMWPSLQAQFGATGPGSCPAMPDGAETVDGPASPVKKPGCCDAGDGAPVGMILLVGALLVRRRRR
jgi:hypothetical protein